MTDYAYNTYVMFVEGVKYFLNTVVMRICELFYRDTFVFEK